MHASQPSEAQEGTLLGSTKSEQDFYENLRRVALFHKNSKYAARSIVAAILPTGTENGGEE